MLERAYHRFGRQTKEPNVCCGDTCRDCGMERIYVEPYGTDSYEGWLFRTIRPDLNILGSWQTDAGPCPKTWS